MTQIAFMGLGAMGIRMVTRLIQAGHQVTVYNRTRERANDLVNLGVTIAASPAEAVNQCEVAISVVRDDNASRDIWLHPKYGALAHLPQNAVAIESSTLTPAFIAELNTSFTRVGKLMLDAPVVGSRPQAETGQLVFLVGGEPDVLQQVHPLLDIMGSKTYIIGKQGSGATLKLAVNALFGVQVAAIGELIGFLSGHDLQASSAVEVLTSLPVCSPAAKVAASAMLAEKFDPLFPIELVEKDFGYVVQSAGANNTPVPISAAAHQAFGAAVAAGFGGDNITGIAQLFKSAMTTP